MHKIVFLGHRMRASGAIEALYLKALTQRNFVAEFHRENVSFTRKTANSRFVATHFLGGLRGNLCDLSSARWRAESRLSLGYK